MPSESPRVGASGLFDLSGRKAIVPGGYGGIGAAIARGLAAAGASVVVAGRNESKAEALARSLRDAGHSAHAVVLDVERVESIREAVDRAAQLLDGIDILVNCIGK